jgi:hypothetical protein
MRPVSTALGLFWVGASSSVITDAVSSVVIAAGSFEDLSTTGEDNTHTSWLEKILIYDSVNTLLNNRRETDMIP